MKQAILIMSLSLFCLGQAFAVGKTLSAHTPVSAHVAELHPGLTNMTIDDFLNMKPRDYKRLTGERLGVVNAVKLKVAQRKMKKMMPAADSTDISSGLYVLLAILGFGWLAMGLITDWDGDDWIINLVLTILCWLPGLIHALVKKSDYY